MDHHHHRTTIHNFAALLASKNYISSTTSEIPKNCTRYTAENSLIFERTLICVIAATHYEVVTEKSSDVEKDIGKFSIGVKKLYKVVTKIFGNLPVFQFFPELILSTDDTVDYIFEGKGSDNGIFRLVASKENTNSGTRSKYKNEDKNNM